MSRIFVTGAIGLTGSNVCKQLSQRGDKVRALVRASSKAETLAEMGVELVVDDITDADSVRQAAEGCDAAIHTAALLGGASQDLADFEAVNFDGTRHVLDAAAALDMRRVVALSTGTFFDTTGDRPLEEAPIAEHPSDDPYTVTKLAAFREAHARAAAGQDVVTCHPGAIYGPGPVTWVFGDDVARGSIAALDHGVSGERYMLDGRPQDVVSIAVCCNMACEIAGLPDRVEDVEVSDDPALLTDTPTSRRLGYQPTSLDDGLAALVDWLRKLGRID